MNKEFFKKNKVMIGVLGSLVLLILTLSVVEHKSSSVTQNLINQTNTSDEASGDDTAESLNALTQELHTVVSSNKELQSNNAALNQKNDQILQNIRSEVQQNLEEELQKRGQDDQAKISELQSKLQRVDEEIRQENESESVGGSYQNSAGGLGDGVSQIKLNGQNLISTPDISGSGNSTGPLQNANDSSSSGSVLKNQNLNSDGSLLHSAGGSSSNSVDSQASNQKPYYTIPNGSTLSESVTMTALIGRVPVDGSVKAPYPFKMVIGGENLAANGLSIPGISGAIVQGFTVGDMALSCVKGYVTSITFLFPDGTISTTTSQDSGPSESSEDLGFSNSLGYLSTPSGNPCFPGKFYTNAPEYLSTIIALGALNQGGQAYAMAQQTSMSNAMGGATTALTGSVGKFMLGGAVQGGTQQAMDWYTAREKNSFDAVYVKAGQKAVINITQQIPIDYDSSGRKIAYENKDSSLNNTSLD